MGPTVAATVFGLAAIFAAVLLRPGVIKDPAILRAAAFWILSVPILFLITLPLLSLLTCGVLLFALAPGEKGSRLSYYFLTFSAVPAGIEAQIPFPGLNYLFILDFPKVAFFALLIAAFLTAVRPPASKHAPAIGTFVVLLTLLFAIMAFRSENMTSGVRSGVNFALTYALPYVGLIRLMEKDDALDKVFAGLIFLALIFFCSSLVSQATKWNFYDFLSGRIGLPVFADFRNGILRASVTLNTVLAGYLLGLGLLAIAYFRSLKTLGFVRAWLYRGMFALGAFFTYSRGAWLAIGLCLAVYVFFTKAPRGLRPTLMTAGAIVGVPAALIYSLNADFGAIDAYGTFAYRQDLVRATLVHFQHYPLFGDAYFYDRAHFAHLLQGQGIIDFVNRYVQIVVEYGGVGLFLFIAPWAALLIGLLTLPTRARDFWGSPAEYRRAAMLAVTLSYLVLIATTSDVSYMKQFGVAILALGAGFIGAVRAKTSAARAEPAPAEQGDLDLAEPALAGTR
ncbi:MAG: O-antigen ligase family protein [Parvularculaceae bacterium]